MQYCIFFTKKKQYHDIDSKSVLLKFNAKEIGLQHGIGVELGYFIFFMGLVWARGAR